MASVDEIRKKIFVPDGSSVEQALARTTHMGIGAHQDDVELVATPGILECFGKANQAFFGVTVTNGAGTPRDGIYAGLTEAEMIAVRYKEQKKAAVVGEYAGVALLDYPSSAIKAERDRSPVKDLKTLLTVAQPRVVYTHNPADRHATHVAVMLRVVEACRALAEDARPEKLYGMEVWRDLDWLTEEDKICFDVSGHDNLAAALIEVYDSQNCGGKRYDQAAVARRRAHAVFARSHDKDERWQYVCFGMDLTPLIMDTHLSIKDYTIGCVDRFKADVASRLKMPD